MVKGWMAAGLAVGLVGATRSAEKPTLENPMTVEFLQRNLAPSHPRLVFTPEIVAELKEKIKTDPVLRNLYTAIRLNAEELIEEPLLTRKMVGRRLLGTSRDMLYRVNMLGVVFLMDGDQQMLNRLNEEVLAVCGFKDWNPSHFLDVAEMSTAVALALDWTHGKLPPATVELAKKALIEKGLEPSWPANGKAWRHAYGGNNWNQVCNGGMIAAALAVAENEPELAAKTIHRALDGLPNVLVEYAPDGVYPEGSSYWGYGTGFSIMTIAMLESAFDRDFGISQVPGFMESAVFRTVCTAPSGMYYNFADCSDHRSKNGDVLLAWFAAKTGNRMFFEKERFLQPPDKMSTLSRFTGAAMAWLSQYKETNKKPVPACWKGEGANPIVVLSGGKDDSHRYYFGGKGGRATTSHGNMDAGSFVFELNGVRWVVDSGNQSYNALEKTGFKLWGRGQDSQRWTLLTKNNFGHSTLTLNDELFAVDGFAPLVGFKDGKQPEAAFDLTDLYGDNVQHVQRRFVKDGQASLLIEDRIETSADTDQIVWQLMTTADVELVDGGAILRQDGEVLNVRNLSVPEIGFVVVSLDPPPLELDRRIKGLKRLELRVPADSGTAGKINVRIQLSEGE